MGPIILLLMSVQLPVPAVRALPPSTAFTPLSPDCGRAYAGRMVSSDAADADMAGISMVMHVRVCDAGGVQIPFHVGDDRSRTWFLTQTPAGLRLKHRHRHADGSLDRRTFYGGTATEPPLPLAGGGWRQQFPVDDDSKRLFVAEGIPQSTTNVWAIEHVPGRLFAYELRREGRYFRVEFDLTRPVDLPPPPWGDADQAQR
ncbi:MAG: hypothetical protein ACK4Z0_02260 [Sphingomonadaceae bacterium]